MLHRFPFALLILFTTAAGVAADAELQRGYRPLIAAMHIHTQFSNGEYSVIELARLAQERKLDAVGFCDSFLSRVRYGAWPLRKLLSRSVSRNGVAGHGIAAYLASVTDAQKRYPDVVFLAGLEVAPYYRWQGTIWNDLRLLDFDRHLQIYGLRQPADIRNLPVIENETWQNTQRDWSQTLAPGALAIAGILLLFIRQRGSTGLGLLFLIVGSAWLYDRYPFGALSDPYSGEHDVSAYQKLVDYVDARGGLAFWSYPEARAADVRASGVRMVSEGNPQDLWLVDRYRGFEGLYGDRITVTQPGGIWDRILVEYLKGSRTTWPSVITGIDFHSFKKEGGWYELDRGQTILWAKEKSEAAVLDALRKGRGYAAFQGGADNLILRNYSLTVRGTTALAGETLTTSAPVTFSAIVDWEKPPKSSETGMASFEVVRDGQLVDTGEYPFPLRLTRSEALASGRHYYRIRVRYNGYEILANPVFCIIH